jgi:hypothetical protein
MNADLRGLVAGLREAITDWGDNMRSETMADLLAHVDRIEQSLSVAQGQGFSSRTLYDQRDAVYSAAERAGPKLYSALKRLLDAVEERRDQCGIESLTISDAHNALLAAAPAQPDGVE